MFCRNCGCKMRIDDTDRYNSVTYDRYFVCDDCFVGCILEVRKSKILREIWHFPDAEESDLVLFHSVRPNLNGVDAPGADELSK